MGRVLKVQNLQETIVSRYISFILTVTLMFNGSAFAYCSNQKGYTFGYLNGVATTPETARKDIR